MRTAYIKRATWLGKLVLSSIAYRAIGRKTAHFLHIRKAGGTAIKEALSPVSRVAGYRIVLHQHSTRLKHVPRGDKVFFFVRDPISRFISGFYDRKRKGMPRYNIPWTPIEEETFRVFQTPNDLAIALSSKDHHLREAAIRALTSIPHLSKHYNFWLGSKQYLLSRRKDILFIGLQESLSQDFEILKDLLGIPRYMARLPDDPIRAHISPPNENKTLEPEAIRNLREWYRGDYELYELCLQIREEILRSIT